MDAKDGLSLPFATALCSIFGMPTQSSLQSKKTGRFTPRLLPLALPCLLLLSLAGCKQTPEQIGNTVKGSMQQTFDKDPNFSPLHFHVDSVNAVKHTDTDTASITYQGAAHSVPVHITLNGDKVNWKTDPGSLSFAE